MTEHLCKRREVVADSSSLILLQKSGIIDIFIQRYSVIIAPAVYDELTLPQKNGAAELAALLGNRVKEPVNNHRLPGMGIGESCSIHLYNEGYGSFLLLDDKKAAKYCRVRGIPFFNCLLLPKILCSAAVIDEGLSILVTKKLIENGYYSGEIIAMADSMPEARLREFQPN